MGRWMRAAALPMLVLSGAPTAAVAQAPSTTVRLEVPRVLPDFESCVGEDVLEWRERGTVDLAFSPAIEIGDEFCAVLRLKGVPESIRIWKGREVEEGISPVQLCYADPDRIGVQLCAVFRRVGTTLEVDRVEPYDPGREYLTGRTSNKEFYSPGNLHGRV